MKKLLSKVFFASDCAKGAAFAFTLLTAGNWLWFSFFHLLALCLGKYGRLLLPLFICSVVGALLIMLYSLALAVISLVGLVKVLRRERRFKALWYLVPAVVCLALGAFGVVGFFPPMWILYCFVIGIEVPPLVEMVENVVLQVAPAYRAGFFFLSLLILLAGGLMPGAMCAAAAGKKFRSAFGKAALALWGAFALWHLFALGLALYESHEVAVARRMVERRFGRPLSAAGLEAMYREGGKVDAAYWARLEKLDEALAKAVQTTVGGGEWTFTCLPDRPTAEDLALFDRFRRENRTTFEELEKLCDAELPLPEKKFVPGSLCGIALPGLQWARRAADRERARLIRALAAKDAETAWQCYRRIGNIAAYLKKEPALIGALVWIHIGKLRLDCIEKLLDSRLLSDDKLDRLADDLAALEHDIPRVHERSMYSEAVFNQDVIFAFEEGLISVEPVEKLGADARERSYPGAFAPYRWIFPVGWYHAARDKKSILQLYLYPDFRHFPKTPENAFFYFSNSLTPVFGNVGDRFYALTARVRGMRVLIRAEKYRRKHGEFPKTLADLPEDPFTGKPLVYELGKAKIVETVWEVPERPVENTVKTTVDAVSVRSPATLPRSLRQEEENHYEDATRAMIRY